MFRLIRDNIIRFTGVFLFTGLPVSNVAAQELSSMKFDVFDQSQGLAGNWITDLALDSSGFVWIGTREGLSRFDGYSFTTFKTKIRHPASLLNDHGQRIWVHTDGTVWISYAEGYFSRYLEDCRCFEHLKIPEARVKHGFDKDFGIKYIDRQGAIWFSGDGLGLNIYHPDTKKTEHWDLPGIKETFSATDHIENNTVHYVYASDGLFWLATQQGLYSFRREKGSFTFYPVNSVNPLVKEKASFNKLIPEGDKGFWVSSWEGGLNYFDKATGKFTNYLFENKAYGYYNLIYDIGEKNANELYLISGDRGLGIFNKQTGHLEFNKKLQNRLNPDITFLIRMLKLPSGVIFLADQTSLLKYNPEANRFVFRSLSIASSQHGDLFSIRKIQRWPGSGEWLFATDLGNGLNIVHPETGVVRALPVETHPARDPKVRVRNLLFDRKARLWVITRDYMYYMDRVNGPLVRAAGYPVRTASELPEYLQGYVSAEGDIWMLLTAGTLHRLNTDNGTLGTALGSGGRLTAPGHIRFAAFGPQGRLWVFADGVLKLIEYDADRMVSIQMAETGISDPSVVKGIQPDKQGGVWVAVSGRGLLNVGIQNGKFSYTWFGKSRGLTDERLYGIGTDTAGKVWLSVMSGVIMFDPETRTFRKFGHASGVDRFTMSMNFFTDNRGDFYITSLSRYCRVNPVQIAMNSKPPDIYLDAFKVFDEDRIYRFSADKAVRLAPGEDFFAFDFGCRDFGDQTSHRFMYMLEGWDQSWVQAGSRRHAAFTNLPEGDYVFRVKVINGEGFESQVLSVPVHVETRFYKKRWFVVLSAVVFSVFIFLLYLIRIRRIRRNESMKARMNEQILELRMEAMRSQMNPHFIFNSLNSINRYIIKNDPKTSSLYLTRFASLMRMVLDNSRHKTISLEREIETLRLYLELEAFRFDQRFNWTIEIDPELDASAIRIPPLIVQPYAENAIWHGIMHAGRQGRLVIRFYKQDHLLVVEITDNGVGRAKSAELQVGEKQGKTSHGQEITRERISLTNREYLKDTEIVDLYDENGEAAGTRVLLYINCLYDQDPAD